MDTKTKKKSNTKRHYYWIVSVRIGETIATHGVCGTFDEAITWITRRVSDGPVEMDEKRSDVIKAVAGGGDYQGSFGYQYSMKAVMVDGTVKAEYC